MISDKLYSQAFEYRKTKLWELLMDTEVFAYRLSDGSIGYICILGMAGECKAVNVYLGREGLDSLRVTAGTNPYGLPQIQMYEHFLQQNCLQCAFEKKADVPEEEQEEAKAYARRYGVRIGGWNAYPRFLKYQPNCCPWPLQSSQEQEILCEALSAAVRMAELVREQGRGSMGFKRILEDPKEIPMLELKAGAYVLETIEVPEEQPKKWPVPGLNNDISAAKLKKAGRSGVWECEIVCFPQPVQNQPDEVPFFPFVVLAVEEATEYLLPVPPVEHYQENPEELLNVFIEALLMQKICPIEIKVRDGDERTYAFLQEFCRRMKIRLRMEKELPELDAAEDQLMEHLNRSEEEELEDFTDMLGEILELDDEQLLNMPPEMIEQILMMAEQEILPDELVQKVYQRFQALLPEESKGRKRPIKKTRQVPPQSYVISVSLGTGCYRHIQISGSSKLLALHTAILDAFGFDDDHAHAFFMDNQVWSDQDSYYMEGIEDGGRVTSAYRLNQAGLYKGKQFKYVFDFGDEWRFQCKVLRIVEGDTPEPAVIRSRGEAPQQYPDWDDE